MGILGILLLVVFVIIAVLLILLVLVQGEDGDSIGGIFAGGSSSAFGSRAGNVLTRATSILGALFLILSLGLALVNRSPTGSGVEKAGQQQSAGQDNEWWKSGTSSNEAPQGAAPAPSGADGSAPALVPEAPLLPSAPAGTVPAPAGESAAGQ